MDFMSIRREYESVVVRSMRKDDFENILDSLKG